MRVVENRPIPAFANLILKQKKENNKNRQKRKNKRKPEIL
jgi:hypothetical protein